MTDTVKKLSAFTICVKFVMALVTLAGGLLLIRLFGEKRIQWILNNVLPKKQIQEQAWSPGACMPAVGTEPSAEECWRMVLNAFDFIGPIWAFIALAHVIWHRSSPFKALIET